MSLFILCKVMFSETELLSYDILTKFLNVLIICITVVIVAVPEGLPMAVSIAMAFSVSYMKKD
jgi:Ca2+-transporting ATPase